MLQYLQGKLIYRPRREKVSRDQSGLPVDRVRHVRVRTDDGLLLNGWLCLAAGERDRLPADGLDIGPGQNRREQNRREQNRREQNRRELNRRELNRPGLNRPGLNRPGLNRHDRSRNGRKLILYCPGTTGHRGYRLKAIQQLTSLGCDVLIVDYRGYAENAGSPSERRLVRDARQIWNYANEQLGVRPQQIVIYGESLGGGVATRLAADLCRHGDLPAGLILRSTFTSLVDVAAERYTWLPVRMFMIDRFDSRRHIGRVTCPVMIIHGTRDRRIPVTHGRKLFRCAPPRAANGIPRRFVELPGAGHDDVMYAAPDRMREAHAAFLDSLPLPAQRAGRACGVDASA